MRRIMRKNIIKVVASVLFAITAIITMGVFATAFALYNIVIALSLLFIVIYVTVVTDYNDNEDVEIAMAAINGTAILSLFIAVLYLI